MTPKTAHIYEKKFISKKKSKNTQTNKFSVSLFAKIANQLITFKPDSQEKAACCANLQNIFKIFLNVY